MKLEKMSKLGKIKKLSNPLPSVSSLPYSFIFFLPFPSPSNYSFLAFSPSLIVLLSSNLSPVFMGLRGRGKRGQRADRARETEDKRINFSSFLFLPYVFILGSLSLVLFLISFPYQSCTFSFLSSTLFLFFPFQVFLYANFFTLFVLLFSLPHHSSTIFLSFLFLPFFTFSRPFFFHLHPNALFNFFALALLFKSALHSSSFTFFFLHFFYFPSYT